jgi:hypothetical protein
LKLASSIPSLNFTPNLKKLHQLLYENQIEITLILPITSLIKSLWINSSDTNIELSTLKKSSTNPLTYKQHYVYLIQNIYSETIYTDISKGQKGVGAGVIWNKQEFIYKLPNACSIFTAEYIAILKSLLIINNHNLKDTILLTDSLSVINSIKNTHNT